MHRRYLIIDDSRAVREVLRQILEMRGVPEDAMAFVTRGDEAMDAFEATDPDIVFLDINMPGMQGDEVAETLLARDPGATVIGVTGLRLEDDQAVRMRSAGVFDILSKPLRKAHVDRVLRQLEQEQPGRDRIV